MVICCAAVNCSNRQGKGEKRAVSFHRYAARPPRPRPARLGSARPLRETESAKPARARGPPGDTGPARPGRREGSGSGRGAGAV